MSKGRPRDCHDGYRLCLDLWSDVLTVPFSEVGYAIPDPSSLEWSYKTTDREALLRLALLADFYKYQRDVLCFNREHATNKLKRLRLEFLSITARVDPTLQTDPAGGVEALPTDERPAAGDAITLPKSCKRGSHLNAERDLKWSQLSATLPRRSYHTKMIRTFQQVKSAGHPLLTINSSWDLSAYFSLATAYTTDSPLELAAACFPELRQTLLFIHAEQYNRLRTLAPKTQMLLYGVLNCHINWVAHNHMQIVVLPRQTEPPASFIAKPEGDLRCSRCLKNQTFHSSEVRGNPRNIDVEFDLDTMSFRSSCCSATVVNVPLRTPATNTCTYTEMKQMYTSCPKCAQTIFSEVLVDTQTLYARCVTCDYKPSAQQ